MYVLAFFLLQVLSGDEVGSESAGAITVFSGSSNHRGGMLLAILAICGLRLGLLWEPQITGELLLRIFYGRLLGGIIRDLLWGLWWGPYLRAFCGDFLWGPWMVTASGDLFKSQRAAPGGLFYQWRDLKVRGFLTGAWMLSANLLGATQCHGGMTNSTLICLHFEAVMEQMDKKSKFFPLLFCSCSGVAIQPVDVFLIETSSYCRTKNLTK